MAGLCGLKILLLCAGIIGSTNSVSAPPPLPTTTNSTLPSVTSQSVLSSTPRTVTEAPVTSSDTPITATIPPLTSPSLTSNSSIQPQNSPNTSDTTPASTPPSPTTTITSASKQIDPQTNTTQNQTSPPITTPKAITAPPPPQCSYTVTPTEFGFKIDITSLTSGTYAINILEEGRPETVKNSTVQHSNQTSSHEIKHLKLCTEYEHNVVFIDSTGNETHCTLPEKKTETGMSEEDIKEVSCTPGYVCYRSEWDISSSQSDNITAEPCTSDNKMFCIKPGYDDICSELTTTFTSENCANSLSLTKNISVDFLKPSEIHQTIPKGLPAEIEPTLPPNCKDLTIDYTCQEQPPKLNESKKLSELEPFTDYSCVGQVKNNNVTTNKTTAVEVRIDCDLIIDVTKLSVTNTSIDLSWNTTSQNCQDVLPDLQKLSYDCSCRPTHKQKASINQHPQGRTCHIAGLEPFTDYTCEVHPTYNNMKVDQKTEVKVRTDIGNNDKALIGCLVFFVILITCVVLAVVIYFLKFRKSRNDMNEDMTLEPIYANTRPPGWRHKEAR